MSKGLVLDLSTGKIIEQEFEWSQEELTEHKKASEQHEIQTRHNVLQGLLASTDYQAIKFAEGWISDEEYEPIRKKRQEWRDEINRLEKNQEVKNGTDK